MHPGTSLDGQDSGTCLAPTCLDHDNRALKRSSFQVLLLWVRQMILSHPHRACWPRSAVDYRMRRGGRGSASQADDLALVLQSLRTAQYLPRIRQEACRAPHA